VAGSLVLLIICLPIMLAVALAIWLQDHGDVFYRQVRLTKDEKEFKIIKFRSMVMNAEKHTGVVLARENDDRITPVGRFIRKTRLDELPQLINILLGDMSFVGPRPERPEIYEEICRTMPEFRYRLVVKAGLTGYAQVYGKYNTTAYDKLKLDLFYVQRYSLWLDVRLVLMTIKVLFLKESTEGLEEGERIASSDKDRK
jgi:lipopolysaccharide/colanic/teichoic acid biosynthesis glycosyltransferase